jgi:TRAP-type uncharacterized transport system substrate-binding protein
MTERVHFAASAIGSQWWEGGLLLKKALAGHGIELVLDDKSSNIDNVLSVADGRNQLGITVPQFVDWAQRGLSYYAGKRIPELRVVAALGLPFWMAAAVDRSAGITSLDELAEKRFPWKCVMPQPNNLVAVYIERIMREHGLTRENILAWGGADPSPMQGRTAEERAHPAGPSVMRSLTAQLAKSGAANGFFLYMNGNSEWVRDLTTLRDLRFLRFDEGILDAINTEWGATKMTLPARTFNGVDEDLAVAGWRYHYVYGTEGVPDDLARAVLHALEDERILDNAAGFSFSGFRPHLPPGVKLHRVAEEYYRRAG